MDEPSPALGAHDLDALTGESHGGEEVQLEGPDPVGVGQVAERHRTGATGIVDQDVESSEPVEALGDDRPGGIGVGDVGPERGPRS